MSSVVANSRENDTIFNNPNTNAVFQTIVDYAVFINDSYDEDNEKTCEYDFKGVAEEEDIFTTNKIKDGTEGDKPEKEGKTKKKKAKSTRKGAKKKKQPKSTNKRARKKKKQPKSHKCTGWKFVYKHGYTETVDKQVLGREGHLLSPSISAVKIWKHKQKGLCVVFRGSQTISEWISNLKTI